MPYTAKLADVNQAFTMLQKYSVEPASQPEGYTRGATHVFGGANDFSGFRHEVVSAAMCKAYVKLTKNATNGIRVGGTGAGGALLIDAKIAQTAGYAPCYYLPWDHRGGAVEMSIAQNASLNLDTHPQVFFTTALSGCSVVFKGTAQNPTVYHCGSQDLAMPYDANQFWEDFVNYVDTTHSTDTPGSQFGLGIVSQAKKMHYVTGRKDPTAKKVKGGSTPMTTQTALDYKSAKQTHYGGQVAIEQMIPWGAVFGLRRGNDWTFYLQENVNIVYYTQQQVQIVKTYLNGLVTRTKTSWQRLGVMPKIVSRPMLLREVFPGNGAVIQPATFKTLL